LFLGFVIVVKSTGYEIERKLTVTSGADYSKRGGENYIKEMEKVVNIVSIDPSKIVDDAGNPIDLTSTAHLRRWLIQRYNGVSVEVADNGHTILLDKNGLSASLKRRGQEHHSMYADLDNLIKNSVYYGYDLGDVKHPWIDRQNIYYAAARIGGDVYGIRFKVDIEKGEDGSSGTYKDHKIVKIDYVKKVEIEKSPSPYRGLSPRGTEGDKTDWLTNPRLPEDVTGNPTLKDTIRGFKNPSINKISDSSEKVNSKDKKNKQTLTSDTSKRE